ncbi:MAG TPA: tyrosine-type recombinase/integrase [Solirubrobacteraceae bacterium]|jgi:integrase
MNGSVRPISGHVFRVDGKRGPRWYAKYRLPDGRQVQKALGPAWTQRGRPAEGCFTKRTAEAWLRDVLDQAHRGTLSGMVRTGATFADAAAEWLRYVEQERGHKASTLADYRSVVRAHLLPAFGDMPLERIDSETIERWLSGQLRDGELSRRSLQKFVVLLNGIFKRARKVWKLPQNPVADIERVTAPQRTDIEFYSPEEVHALVRAAHDKQDGALFLTAAMTGLRMGELLALRWRDVDFSAQTVRVTASYTVGKLGTPKSGLGRAVPLVQEVAEALARLGNRERWTGPDDVVFVGQTGEYLDGSALRRRFKRARDAAGLRPLRFHDLRHTFGSVAIRTVDPRELQEWMGHSDFSTTQIYMHYRPRADAARRLSAAFGAVDGDERWLRPPSSASTDRGRPAAGD